MQGSQWAGVAVAMAAGVAIGRVPADLTPERRTRTLVLALALGGGVTTLAKGIFTW
ncbi:hypothetical protein [Streptomyces sp. NPDC049813]|uniref:hypothetical protein n=1 Tax=Streptomyces sp. NPDC049813 TaxID=3365597 RepID=UPI0037BA9616